MMTRIVVCSSIAFAAALGSSIVEAQNSLQTSKNPHVAAIEQQIAGKEQQPAEQVFKDIQVFKGMPAIRVLRIMEMAFNANLGVDCDHCHSVDDWSSGAKRQRDIAREMWILRGEVQEKLRKITGKADLPMTCYTCHKGKAKPAFAPE
jgi:Photosynthetic reaction centre cytochrome C subunit